MTDKWPQDIYVLIPSYKSRDALRKFFGELFLYVPKNHVCVVDDGSNDGTYEYCAGAQVTCLRHNVNKGKGAALKTGFAHLLNSANANWIITMDADGQHAPADLYRFVRTAKNYPQTGLCIGARDMRFGMMPIARIVSNRLTSFILSVLTRRVIEDSQCGYRMYSRKLLSSIDIIYSRFEMESEVIIKAARNKFSIRFARAQTLYLKDGGSHISHVADTLRWVIAAARLIIDNKNTDK